jgi:hypothetical protein
MKKEEILPIVGGALGATVFDLVIDFPLSDAGLLGAWRLHDSEGRYVWGIGTGDLIGFGVGGALALGGHVLAQKGRPRGETIRNAGLGWLLTLGCIKIAELYGYLTALHPVTYIFQKELPITSAEKTPPYIKEI